MSLLRLPRFRDSLAILLLVLWPFIYYWPVTLGRKVFVNSDMLDLFLPVHAELARALAEWRLPLWTTGVGAGYPLFAEGQVGALYLPNIPFHLLLPSAIALSFSILYHKAWIALGIYLLCRSLGLGIASAFVGGAALGFGGFMTAHTPHPSLAATASWLPWLLLFQVMFWRAEWEKRPTGKWSVLICLAIALQFLAGYPPIALFNIVVFLLCGTAAPLIWRDQTSAQARSHRSIRETPRYVLQTGLQVALGTGIAAVQLIPTAELSGLSTRSRDLGLDFFTYGSLDPRSLAQFVSPFTALGEPNPANIEYWAYVGVLPLVFALLAVVLRRDLRTFFFSAIAFAAILLALGGNTPLYQLLYNVPVFNRFRVPARFLFLVSFAVAFLAAMGLEKCRRYVSPSQTKGWSAIALAAVFMPLVLFTINLGYLQSEEWWLETWRIIPFVLFLLSAATILLIRWHPPSQAMSTIIVVGLVLLDLTCFAAPHLTTLAETTPPADLGAPRTVAAMDKEPPLYRFFSADRYPATKAATRAALIGYIPLLYGKQGAAPYWTLELQRTRDYIQQMSGPLRDLMNIRYYLSPLEPLPHDAEPKIGLSLELLEAEQRIPPTPTARVELVSFVDGTGELSEGYLVGELLLGTNNGEQLVLPIRLGRETEDWAIGARAHGETAQSVGAAAIREFPAYSSSAAKPFRGREYLVRYALSPNETFTVSTVLVRSYLPEGGLNVERISFIDAQGHSVSLASLLGQNELDLAFRTHAAAMWENRDVLPRAFVVHRAEVVEAGQALHRMLDPNFRPGQLLVLEKEQNPVLLVNPTEREETDQATITDYEPEHVTVQVSTTKPGYLILTDTWYPGWIASVDNRPAPIYTADHIFRAVLTPAGEHTIVFEYRPLSFMWGLLISAVSLLLCISLATSARFLPKQLSYLNRR